MDETREYAEWSDDEELVLKNERFVGINSGIIAAKKAINKLHFYLGNCGFNQVFMTVVCEKKPTNLQFIYY